MTRGPSLQAEPLLNTPSPHSRVVERLQTELLKWWSFDDFQCHTHTWHTRTDFIFTELPKIMAEYEAATIISELEAEVQRLSEPSLQSLRMENGRFDMAICGPIVERLALAMTGWYQENGGKNYSEMTLHSREEPFESFVVTVQKRGAKSPHELRLAAEARALAAESSLHRVRGETVEEIAALVENHRDVRFLAAQDNWTVIVGKRIANEIRSLTKTGEMDSGAAKTAESSHSPSTLNAETE